MAKRRLIASLYNYVSMAGGLLALTAFGVTLTLMLMEWASGQENPYLGIITYILMPSIMIVGLLLVPFGVWRLRRREKKGEGAVKLPVLDLNNPQHRLTATVFTVGSMILVVFTSLGTFRVYEFSESNSFCGETCHSVMAPEFVTNQHSSHAEVECVTCHVGSGATHYIKAKFNGVNQLMGVITGNFARPIETPVHTMRTGKEICQSCHVPEKDHGLYHLRSERYKFNKRNSRYVYDLLINVGGLDAESGDAWGAHWHAFNRVEYAPADQRHLTIPWFRVTNADGTTRTYGVPEAEPPADNWVTMDCMSCHNRKAHAFLPPQVAVDDALATGKISRDLLRIKDAGVSALNKAAEQEDKDQGLATIAAEITTYYEDEEPEVLEEQGDEVKRAIAVVQGIYGDNYFPNMKTNWTSHPNHMGHYVYPGCVRCHDGNHESDDGKVLEYDCSSCHSIIAFEDSKGEITADLSGLEYVHPDRDEEDWVDTGCHECHGE